MSHAVQRHNSPDMTIERLSFRNFAVPEFGAPEHHSAKNTQIIWELTRLAGSEMVLFSDQYRCFNEVREPIGSFTITPGNERGRKRSKQGVVFGKLEVQSDVHMPVEEDVAVKPYGRNITLPANPLRSLVHEWAVNAYLNSVSSGTAYDPLGVWMTSVKTPSLLTKFMRRSQSLDNVFAPDGRTVEYWSQKKVFHALELGFFGSGLLVGIGATHGDAWPQNFAMDGSRVLLNDTTTIRPFSSVAKRTKDRIEDDLDKFVSGAVDDEIKGWAPSKVVPELLGSAATLETLFVEYERGIHIGGARSNFRLSDELRMSYADYKAIIRRAVEKGLSANSGRHTLDR